MPVEGERVECGGEERNFGFVWELFEVEVESMQFEGGTVEVVAVVEFEEGLHFLDNLVFEDLHAVGVTVPHFLLSLNHPKSTLF